MLRSQQFLLMMMALSFWHFDAKAQYDSTSSVTINHYRADTLFWQTRIIQKYYQGNLIFERKETGLEHDDFNFEMTTNFYDLDGDLIKSVVIEEKRHGCQPNSAHEFEFYPIITFNESELYFSTKTDSLKAPNLPDSIPSVSKFCGSHLTETTLYSPFTEVTSGLFYYDELDTVYTIDSVFFNRYGNKIREITYFNNELFEEYKYDYDYDEQGRVIEERWNNVTPKLEFRRKTIYAYAGEHKMLMHYSYYNLKRQEKSYTNFYYDENFNIKRREEYEGDTLVSTVYFTRTDQESSYYTVTSDDTTQGYQVLTKTKKNKSESWHYQFGPPEEYEYKVADTIYKKDVYFIEAITYIISKEQFVARKRPKKNKNRIIYNSRKQFDKFNRLIARKLYTTIQGTREYTYDYDITD